MIVWIIFALNVLLWIANIIGGLDPVNPSSADLLKWGGNHLPATVDEPWRLLSSTFLHAGMAHLVWNMLALVQLGLLILRFYGPSGFIVIYFFSGILGSIASVFFAARAGVSIGASGAIFGLLGAVMAGALTKRKQLGEENAKALITMGCVYVAFNLLMGFSQAGIDNAAHIGGFIAGALAAVGLPERFDRIDFRRHGKVRLSVTAVLCVAVVFCLWKFILFWFGIPDA
jgi:rhomboid protease GluP